MPSQLLHVCLVESSDRITTDAMAPAEPCRSDNTAHHCNTSLLAGTKHDADCTVAVVATTGRKSPSCGLLYVQMVVHMAIQRYDGNHTLRVLSVFRSRDILESGKKKCNRPKLSKSFRHTSLAKAFIAPGYWTGSSSTTCSLQPHLKRTADYMHNSDTASMAFSRKRVLGYCHMHSKLSARFAHKAAKPTLLVKLQPEAAALHGADKVQQHKQKLCT